MSDERQEPRIIITEVASSTKSLLVSEKLYSPGAKFSPESLRAKPWPTRPQQLYRAGGDFKWWDTAVDFVMVLLPFPFFLLAAAVIAVDGRVVDAGELRILEQSIKGATTLFPICFAAIAGRGAVKYATWKLEQGTTLGHLEQLMGSRTVASTFATQLQLRSWNLAGLGLMIIWSLSPLGGQSVLHILYTPMKQAESQTEFTYFNSRQQSYSAPIGAFRTQWFNGFNGLLDSSILAPVAIKESSMDIFGNPKIPYLSSLLASGNLPNDDGWVKTATPNGSLVYSSLFGIPIEGIKFGNTTFNVESTYLELTCSNITTVPVNHTANGDPIWTDLISTAGPFFTANNATVGVPWGLGYQGLDVSTYQIPTGNASWTRPKDCPDCLGSDYENVNFPSGTLLFQEYEGIDNVTSVYCVPSQSYVESSISCSKNSATQLCEVTAQRNSTLPHVPSSITYLSFPQVPLGMSALLPNSTPIFGVINLIQNYLYNPLSPEIIISTTNSVNINDGISPLQQVPLNAFGQRLGQIVNAYIHGSMWNSTPYITGASFSGMTENLYGGNAASLTPTLHSALPSLIANQTGAITVPGVTTTTAMVFLTFYPWLAIFFLSNLVMLILAIIGVYFSRKTIVPDYLGFVSSLAKESPYIGMPDVGVNMDGMDKARLVRDVKVRLGDVSGEGERGGIGRLAFARLEETGKVMKGRLYV